MVQGRSLCSLSKRSNLFKYNLHSKSLKYHKHIFTIHNAKITKSNEFLILFCCAENVSQLCKANKKKTYLAYICAQQRFAVDLEGKIIKIGNLSLIVGLCNTLWELEYQFVLSCTEIL